MKRINKKGIMVLIVLLSIGFAAVSTNLIINGTGLFGTNIDDFEVIFTESIIDGVNVSKETISEDGKSIVFTTKNLAIMGDKSYLDFEVTNNSKQYDAEITMECVTKGEKANTYYEIKKSLPEVVNASSIVAGNVTVELIKTSVENIEEEFTCTISATAKERTSVGTGLYAFSGTLLDNNNNPVANANLVMFSLSLKYLTTDETGYFQISGVEGGDHEIYYVDNSLENIKAMTKEEIISASVFDFFVNTTSDESEFETETGYRLINSRFIEKMSEKDMVKDNIITIKGDGTNTGDVIAIGTEQFYVISNDGTNLELLAKYNLSIGYACTSTTSCTLLEKPTGIQDINAVGVEGSNTFAEYATTDYGPNTTYSGSYVEGYVNNYVEYLNSKYNIAATGTIFTKEELVELGCQTSTETCVTSQYDWLYSTAYWTRSARDAGAIWYVRENGKLYDGGPYNWKYTLGVRPVLKVSASIL